MKYYLKLILAALLYYSGVARLLRWLVPRRGVAIFMLHSVAEQNSLTQAAGFSMSMARFARRMRFLKGYRCISMSEVADALSKEGALPSDAVVITFDDGYADNCRCAFPILKDLGLPATIYLTTDYVQTDAWLPLNRLYDAIWRTALSNVPVPRLLQEAGGLPPILPLGDEATRLKTVGCLRTVLKALSTDAFEQCVDEMVMELSSEVRLARGREFDMLDWAQVKAMAGLIEFGSHTASHVILARADESRQAREIEKSTLALQSRLGGSIDHFAYPNGHSEDFTDHTISLLKQYGYRTAVTTEVGLNFDNAEPYRLKRMGLEAPVCVIALELLGVTQILRGWVRGSRDHVVGRVSA